MARKTPSIVLTGKASRNVKLAKGGMVFFEVDGVLARTTGVRGTKRSAALTPAEIVTSTEIAGMGAIVAGFIRNRVRQDRVTAQGPFAGHRTQWSAFIIPEYARKIGSSQRFWSSKNKQLSSISKGLFDVSGGMWSGLQSRSNKRGKEVIIDFRDTTEGQHGIKAGKRTIKRGKRKGEQAEVRATPMVSNAFKAATIFNQMDINVVQPTFNEDLSMADAVANKIGLQMAVDVWKTRAQISTATGAKTSLVRKLKTYWEA